jgi:hypothetical protein
MRRKALGTNLWPPANTEICICPGCGKEAYKRYRVYCDCGYSWPPSRRKSKSNDRSTKALGDGRHVKSELVSTQNEAKANTKLVAFREKAERKYLQTRVKNEPPLLDAIKEELDWWRMNAKLKTGD